MYFNNYISEDKEYNMDKLKKKAELLKMLADDMMCGTRDKSMEELHRGRSQESDEKSPVKATIMADSPEGLKQGIKKLPEILDKAEAFRKLRLGSKKKKKK